MMRVTLERTEVAELLELIDELECAATAEAHGVEGEYGSCENKKKQIEAFLEEHKIDTYV